jgi:hypothetical protein
MRPVTTRAFTNSSTRSHPDAFRSSLGSTGPNVPDRMTSNRNSLGTSSASARLVRGVDGGLTKYDLIVNKYGAEVDREDLSGYDASELFGETVMSNREQVEEALS